MFYYKYILLNVRKSGMDLYAMRRNTNRTHYLSLFKKKRYEQILPL